MSQLLAGAWGCSTVHRSVAPVTGSCLCSQRLVGSYAAWDSFWTSANHAQMGSRLSDVSTAGVAACLAAHDATGYRGLGVPAAAAHGAPVVLVSINLQSWKELLSKTRRLALR